MGVLHAEMLDILHAHARFDASGIVYYLKLATVRFQAKLWLGVRIRLWLVAGDLVANHSCRWKQFPAWLLQAAMAVGGAYGIDRARLTAGFDQRHVDAARRAAMRPQPPSMGAAAERAAADLIAGALARIVVVA